MEIIKDLPEVFEEFAEQRQKSFLAVKQLKDKGIPVIGSYCTYFPKEIAMAMGAATVSLCSTSDETIPAAEKDLPRNLCPLIKSSYGFAKTDKCPFFYFSDVVVGETTCDGKKKMYEYMGEFKEVFIMELPQSQKAEVLDLWKAEILRFKEYLEKKFEVTITEEQVREAVKLENEVRTSLKNLYGVMRHDPAPIKGHDLFRVLYGSSFKLDRTLIADEVDALTAKIEKEYAEGKREDKKPRILITGCPIGGATEKIIQIEQGFVKDFIMNDKCAAGTGRFLEVMANTLSLHPNKMFDLARLGSDTTISSMCTVFAESEVIGLIGKGEPKENIAYAVVNSTIRKVAAQVSRMNGEMSTFCLTGGLCECEYIREALSKELGKEVISCPDARYAGAIGAALSAMKIRK